MKLSIITVNYNNRAGLESTIKSIFSQTCDDFEYLIIDGGSSDGSKEIIKEHENRLSYWCSERDKGVYNAMNKGITKAHGEYLLFMNSGDIFFNNDVLKRVIPQLTGEGIIYGNAIYVHPNGRKELVTFPERMSAEFLFRDTLNHQATFTRRDLFDNCPYNESLKIIADHEFLIKKLVIENQTSKYISETIDYYDFSGMSSTNDELLKAEKEKMLHDLFPPMIYEAIRTASHAKKQPFYGLFVELSRTVKFQKRIAPLVRLLLKINNLVSGRK